MKKTNQKTLIIQLSANSTIISRLVQWVTRGEFAHVDIVLPRGALIGAYTFGGIKIVPFHLNNYSKLKRYEIKVDQHTIDWVGIQVGRKYDFMAILGFLLKLPPKENTASICSEFAMDVLMQSKSFKEHSIPFPSSKISPRDLHLILQVLVATGDAKLV